MIPVLCTGRPYFLFTLNRLFQSLCLALLSHATAVPVCMCVTHHLPFYWFWNLFPFLSHFPTRCTIGLKGRTQIAFGGSFELAMSEHKSQPFQKDFRAFLSEDKPAFLRGKPDLPFFLYETASKKERHDSAKEKEK